MSLQHQAYPSTSARIPAVGITKIPSMEIGPLTAGIAGTGTAPAAIGTAPHHVFRPRVMRRPAVEEATPYMSTMNPAAAVKEATTQAIITETATRWAAARTQAVGTARPCPSRPGQGGSSRPVQRRRRLLGPLFLCGPTLARGGEQLQPCSRSGGGA